MLKLSELYHKHERINIKMKMREKMLEMETAGLNYCRSETDQFLLIAWHKNCLKSFFLVNSIKPDL